MKIYFLMSGKQNAHIFKNPLGFYGCIQNTAVSLNLLGFHFPPCSVHYCDIGLHSNVIFHV